VISRITHRVAHGWHPFVFKRVVCRRDACATTDAGWRPQARSSEHVGVSYCNINQSTVSVITHILEDSAVGATRDRQRIAGLRNLFHNLFPRENFPPAVG